MPVTSQLILLHLRDRAECSAAEVAHALHYTDMEVALALADLRRKGRIEERVDEAQRSYYRLSVEGASYVMNMYPRYRKRPLMERVLGFIVP